MKNFKHIVPESIGRGSDQATVSDQGESVGLCIESGDDLADLLLTPNEARELAQALMCAAFLVERNQ